MYQDAQHPRSYSRRASRRIAGFVTAGATQKTDEKTSRLVCHLTEIALASSPPRVRPVGRSHADSTGALHHGSATAPGNHAVESVEQDHQRYGLPIAVSQNFLRHGPDTAGLRHGTSELGQGACMGHKDPLQPLGETHAVAAEGKSARKGDWRWRDRVPLALTAKLLLDLRHQVEERHEVRERGSEVGVVRCAFHRNRPIVPGMSGSQLVQKSANFETALEARRG